ncbi:hypothetical protein A7E78_12520 [Syntrophotalea acetylenivorans]|uniref:Putative Se/S carrier protein-like domain-containing protein n=1 Tax=Syntrophotalea acetylenivorans TaxID=1842532 RepID=A0A1L3GRM6_9BACT|nr:DUF3343 domain-containing protein [Syntrophotalea acetylenivorans]APG28594.1 hypothetical protein A7E78_12520 [Syntrophotalea acetylenivorans]
MIREQDYVALFHSIHKVLAAEKILKEQSVDFLLIPAPSELSSACGLAIRFAPELALEIGSILSDADLTPAELFVRDGAGFRKL